MFRQSWKKAEAPLETRQGWTNGKLSSWQEENQTMKDMMNIINFWQMNPSMYRKKKTPDEASLFAGECFLNTLDVRFTDNSQRGMLSTCSRRAATPIKAERHHQPYQTSQSGFYLRPSAARLCVKLSTLQRLISQQLIEPPRPSRLPPCWDMSGWSLPDNKTTIVVTILTIIIIIIRSSSSSVQLFYSWFKFSTVRNFRKFKWWNLFSVAVGGADCADGRKKQAKWIRWEKQEVTIDGFITVPRDGCQHHWAGCELKKQQQKNGLVCKTLVYNCRVAMNIVFPHRFVSHLYWKKYSELKL